MILSSRLSHISSICLVNRPPGSPSCSVYKLANILQKWLFCLNCGNKTQSDCTPKVVSNFASFLLASMCIYYRISGFIDTFSRSEIEELKLPACTNISLHLYFNDWYLEIWWKCGLLCLESISVLPSQQRRMMACLWLKPRKHLLLWSHIV